MKEPKDRRVNLKLTDSEYTKMRTLMEVYHYQSISRFWRDLLEGKPLVKKHRVRNVSVGDLLDAMNRMTARISIIGRSYNSLVSHIEDAASRCRPDGSPVISDSLLEGNLSKLMTQTQRLRDEVASCIGMMSALAGGTSMGEKDE